MITETIYKRQRREDREHWAKVLANLKLIFMGTYLGSSIAILLAMIPAFWTILYGTPHSWQSKHWECFLGLVLAYVVTNIVIRLLIRFRKFFGALVIGFLAAILLGGVLSLFFGHIAFILALALIYAGMYEDWRKSHADDADDASRIGSGGSGLGSAILSLTRGEKHLLRASAGIAVLGVWVGLWTWYQADANAHVNHFIAPEAPATPEMLAEHPEVPKPIPTPTPAAPAVAAEPQVRRAFPVTTPLFEASPGDWEPADAFHLFAAEEAAKAKP
jgi:hypothetical protein